jgi:hypothetical protein
MKAFVVRVGAGASGTLGSGPTTDQALLLAAQALNALTPAQVCVSGLAAVSTFQTAWNQSSDTTTTGSTQLSATGNYDQPTATALAAALGINTPVNPWCTTFTNPPGPGPAPLTTTGWSTGTKIAVVAGGVVIVGGMTILLWRTAKPGRSTSGRRRSRKKSRR